MYLYNYVVFQSFNVGTKKKKKVFPVKWQQYGTMKLNYVSTIGLTTLSQIQTAINIICSIAQLHVKLLSEQVLTHSNDMYHCTNILFLHLLLFQIWGY